MARICELLWLKQTLEDLKIHCEGPMKLFRHNKSTIIIAHNLIQHYMTNHIEIDRHFIKENSIMVGLCYIERQNI